MLPDEGPLRSRKLLLTITGASLVGVALMIALTIAAVLARNEALSAQARAERQLGQVEGLVEFMLGDLRDKLTPLGQLDALEATGTRALEYFGSPPDDSADADALGRRARTLHLLGQLESRRGNLSKAKPIFAKARQLTARGHAAFPRNAARVFDHAQSVFWVGNVEWQSGNLPAAEAAFLEYSRLAAQLVSLEPKNSRWLKESGDASINLGVVRYQRASYADALKSFAAAGTTFAAIAAARPDDVEARLNLAQVSSWSADAYRAMGNFEAALTEREKERRFYTQLLERDPNDKTASQLLAVVELAMARITLDLGRTKQAIAKYRQSAEYAARLASGDPANANWRELEILTWTELAEAQTVSRNCEAAETSLTRALKVLSTSLAPDTPYLALLGTRMLTAKARCRIFAADTRGALAASNAALDAIGTIIDAASDVESVFVGVEAWLVKGDAQSLGKQKDLAAASWSRALELSGRIESPSRPYHRLLRAQILRRLDRDADANALVGGLQAANYRHPSMNEMTGADATGRKDR
jgi:tetratricopeptide (TPR) repeat protein